MPSPTASGRSVPALLALLHTRPKTSPNSLSASPEFLGKVLIYKGWRVCESVFMAQAVCVLVNADYRARLAAISGDRSRPHKHVLRARIILHSADRVPVLEVARRAGVSRPAVWR